MLALLCLDFSKSDGRASDSRITVMLVSPVMKGVRAEVVAAVNQLGLPRARIIDAAEGLAMYATLEARFSRQPNARWIWEHLIGPSVFRHSDAHADVWIPYLSRLVTSPTEQVFLFAGSDEDDVCVVEADISDIAAILSECPAFEYCIAPPGLSWLLCETHHGSLVGVGAPVADRLASLQLEPAIAKQE